MKLSDSDYKNQLISERDSLQRSFLIHFSKKLQGKCDAYTYFLAILNHSGSERLVVIDLAFNEILKIKYQQIPCSKILDAYEKMLYPNISNTKYLESKMNMIINLLIDYYGMDIVSEN